MRFRRRANVDEVTARATAPRAGIALVYHAVGNPRGDPRFELIPSLGTRPFEAQLKHLLERYRIVPPSRLVASVLDGRPGDHVPVALTFDDDLPSHVDVVAPMLRRAKVPAAFFLCGASLDGLHTYWWQDLQTVVNRRHAVPSRLDSLPEVDLTPALRRVPRALHEIAEYIEGLPPERRDAVATDLRSLAGGPRRALSAREIERLSAAGFEIGFHTRRHHLLSTLDDDALTTAMHEGRDLLEAVVGRDLTMIAYPHGKADGRVASAARAAGYELGFTASPTRVDPTTDPLTIGRVEAQALPAREFARALTAIVAAENRPLTRA